MDYKLCATLSGECPNYLLHFRRKRRFYARRNRLARRRVRHFKPAATKTEQKRCVRKSKYRPNICPSLSVRAAWPLIDGAHLRHQYFQLRRLQPDRRVAFHDQRRSSSNTWKAQKPDFLREMINAPSGCVFALVQFITQRLESSSNARIHHNVADL